MLIIASLLHLNVALSGDVTFDVSGDYKAAILGTVLQQVDTDDTVKTKQKDRQSIEEILIEADPILKSLTGPLRRAFEAFEKGDFAKAEKRFSRLANIRDSQASQQEFVQQNSSLYLPLLADRSVTFSPDTEDGNGPNITRATARSINYIPPAENLRKSASLLYFMRGVAEARQDKFEEAKKSYLKSINANKYNVDARIELALILLREGNIDKATKHINKLDKYAEDKCDEESCLFSPESRDRYSKIRLAYDTMLNG